MHNALCMSRQQRSKKKKKKKLIFLIFFFVLFLSQYKETTKDMSWQAYVDDQLVGTECVTGAAIIGHDGSVWAAKNLALKNGEGAGLAALFNNSSSAFSAGVVVGGVKHLCIRADARSVYGKKVGEISFFFFFFFFFFAHCWSAIDREIAPIERGVGLCVLHCCTRSLGVAFALRSFLAVSEAFG
jgi:hypothetical protein